jgi:hypothetical protein
MHAPCVSYRAVTLHDENHYMGRVAFIVPIGTAVCACFDLEYS